MIIRCIKLAALILSTFGYWEYFREKHKINVYFVPLFTIAVQFCVLFAAGILNCLKEAAILLSFAGSVLLLLSVRERKLKIAKPYLNAGFLYLAVMLAAMLLYTHNRQLSQIDNFTHWGTVVRHMLNTNRFPGSLDTVIRFISYPLGSSAMLYYYCKYLGIGEDMMMLAQGFMMLCAMLPVFAFVRKRIGISVVIITIMTVFLLQYNVPVTELLVDTLMPLAGMAASAFAYHHCVAKEPGEKLSGYYVLPLMIWTMNIKHAALLYVVGTMLVLLAGAKDRKQKQTFLYCFLALFAARFVWTRHCSYINPEVSSSQHAMTLNWFSKIVGDKTKEDILDITGEFLETAVTRRELLWILAFVLLLSLLILVIRRNRKISVTIAAGILAAYAVYGAAVLGTYIFSMPVSEGLNAVDRYLKSGDVAIYYMLLLLSVSFLDRIEHRNAFVVTAMVLLTLTGCTLWFQTGKYSNASLFSCGTEERQRWESPIAEYGILEQHSYLLCVSQEDYANWHNFPMYIWRYQLGTSAIKQIVVKEEAQLEIEKEYDYVVILDENNPIIENWRQENYPQNAGRQVIQHFT